MLEAVAPQPGQRVLELAAGLGETGLLAAELVAPVGGVDHLGPGRGDARGRPRARGASSGSSNVEFQVLNAEWIDLPLASVDVVLCRWGYMLMADPAAALARDAARAAPRRAPRARGVGLDRGEPVGALPRAGAARARAWSSRRRRRRRPGRSRSGRRARARSCSAGRLRRGRGSRRSTCTAGTRASPSSGRSTLDLSRAFHDAVLDAPRDGDRRDQAAARSSASHRSPRPTAELEIPARTLVAAAEALSRR